MSSLRDKQYDALKRILNLNVVSGKSLSEPQWKVLIYDEWSQDIISPLFTVKELRENCVTLHLNLHSEREQIQDVPAVYIISPTDENVARLCNDIQNHLYESFYLNFISAIPRSKLEQIASASVLAENVQSIISVMDQYVQFICLEDDLFITKHTNSVNMSYFGLNRKNMTDTVMKTTLEVLADTLFSVLVTKGQIPIIQCPVGNAAEQLSELLDRKLRDQLKDARTHMFSGGIDASSLHRPLLVILDRDIDLATPLHHTWTYQALVHDVLDLSLNRVKVNGKLLELENKNDKLWKKQRGTPFPEVAQVIQEELEQCKSSEEEIKRIKEAMGIDGEDMGSTTAKLSLAITSLPEILARKKTVDIHIDIAASLLDHIKNRKLDTYFEMEEKLLSKSAKLGDKNLLDFMKDPDAGTPDDKVRLFIISLLCTKGNIADSEIDHYCSVLQEANCNLSPIQYIRRWKSFVNMSLSSVAYGGVDYGTRTESMFTKLLGKASKFAMEGVKNLVVEKHNLLVTKIVDALMELKSTPETDNFRYFDPKILRITDPNNIPRTRNPFQEGIVFIVGGGNYIEYQNLMDYCKQRTVANNSKRKIIYGCTELLNATQFLSQLSKLETDK